MRRLWLTVLIVCPLFGQLDSGSVTVTATRTMTFQPNQAEFAVAVPSAADASLDDVLPAMASAGVTAANLAGITQAERGLTWTFAWIVPLSRTKETIAALQALRLQFQVTGVGVSDDVLSPDRCSMSDLIADARTQADRLARSVGAGVGSVLAVANSPTAELFPVSLAGGFVFASLLPGFPRAPLFPTSSTLNCSLTVKFRLNQ